MSVPLDRLYQYIESIAEQIRGGNVLIYRFFPHGSKKIEDLQRLRTMSSYWFDLMLRPEVYCNDQEPLNHEFYQDRGHNTFDILNGMTQQHGIKLKNYNFRGCFPNIYDSALLIHSERRSQNVELYRKDNFIPVYYWSHAVIARDWFRYGEHVKQNKSVKKKFLIYNRAWSGTREYRLKFADHLVRLALPLHCQMRCNPIDSELNIHYNLHHFKNPAWRPNNVIEQYFPITDATSSYSADFDLNDYESTDIEVVLETLFEDHRLHLTEKILRPIALGQPFILAATHGSLEYLRRYGFKTFGHVWDERYDLETNPEYRLIAITDLMRKIANWNSTTRKQKIAQAREIAEYNRQHFFSEKFMNLILEELCTNLSEAFIKLEETNTGSKFIGWRKELAKVPELRNFITQADDVKTRQDIAHVIGRAAQYYRKTVASQSLPGGAS